MPNFVRTAWTLIAVFMAVSVVAACGDNGTDPDPDPDPTQVRVTVRLDGTATSGVAVGLFSSGGTTALEEETTGGNGQVTFEVDPGSYDVEIEIPADTELGEGQTARKPVTVEEGATAAVTFELITEEVPGLSVVTLNPSSFSPAEVNIATGETVRWVNGDPVAHTITPDGHSEWQHQSIPATEGHTFEHTFNTVGSFDYLCQIHAGMVGVVNVN